MKVVCLIILLTISNANSKPLPSETISEPVKQIVEKCRKLIEETWKSSKKKQSDTDLFNRMSETHKAKTLLDAATKEPFKLSNSTLRKT